MSYEAMGYVKRYSPYANPTYMVHLEIADCVNPVFGNRFSWSLRDFARMTRLDASTVKRAVDQLVADKWLEVLREPRAGRGGSGEYRFLFKPSPVVFDSTRTAPSDDSAAAGNVAGGNVSAPNVARSNVADSNIRPPTATPNGVEVAPGNVAGGNVAGSNVAGELDININVNKTTTPPTPPRGGDNGSSKPQQGRTPRRPRAERRAGRELQEDERGRLPVTWPPDPARMAELEALAAEGSASPPVIDDPKGKAARARALREQLTGTTTPTS